MKQPVKIGIIGEGINSAIGKSHISAIRMDGNYSIGPCIFSYLEEANRLTQAAYGVPWVRHARCLGEWLDHKNEKFDLVALLTPSTEHAYHIKEIAQRGISFITEKPVSSNLEEVQMIEALLLDAEEVKAWFVHNYSGYPMFREMVLRLNEEKIGPIHSVRIEMPSDGFARERLLGRPQVWRQSDPPVPIIMLDLGTHMHHLVRMAIGNSKSQVLARHETVS